MKRITAVILVLPAVFLIGFRAGRSPMLMTMETPPRLDEISRPEIFRSESARLMRFGTTEFLRAELEKARAEAVREESDEARRRAEDLEEKLTKALISASKSRWQ